MSKPITTQPDSMVPTSAPVNDAPNAPAPAMTQDIYGASVQSQMQNRRDRLRARGAVRGKPYPQNEQ
jgi:hypothetical protein